VQNLASPLHSTGIIKMTSLGNTTLATTRDWLGVQNEIQFFIHSSSMEPLSVIGVEDTSQYTIQVRAKSLRNSSLKVS